MITQPSATHKVFLQKRTSSTASTAVEPTPQSGLAPPAASPALDSTGNANGGINCSICGDSLPGARELGVHILAAHCDVTTSQQTTTTETTTAIVEDSLVIEGSPGLSMEVEIDPLEPTTTTVRPTSSILQAALEPPMDEAADEADLQPVKTESKVISLPRAPTANEMKQKFMIYRISDTSHRYICLVCDKVYTSRYNIRMHMNLHNGTNIHTCTFCGRKFAHKHVFESHVRTHTGERPFACEKCGRRFGDRSNCSSHMKRCPAVSGGVQGLAEQMEEEESNSINIAPNVSITPIKRLKVEDEETGESLSENSPAQDPLKLKFCPQIVSVQSMSFIANLNNNITPANSDDFVNMGYDGDSEDGEEASEEMMIEPDISLDYDDIEELEDEGEREGEEQHPTTDPLEYSQLSILTCSFCSCQYDSQVELLEHLRTHVDISHDPAEAELRQGYMTLYTHSRPKFMCLHCGKFFANMTSVNVHVKVHADEKAAVHKCNFCSKVFPHAHLHDIHMQAEHPHQQQKKKAAGNENECLFCHNLFPNAVSLNNHTRHCSSRPIEITPTVFVTSTAGAVLETSLSTAVVATAATTKSGTKTTATEKKKANRPPPKLIMINSNASSLSKAVASASDHILVQQTTATKPSQPTANPARRPITIAPKPTVSLLSEEAKKIFNSSAPSIKQSVPGDNPRAHKIVETSNGREYIPDTNSNNIINLDTIYPEPSSSETKRGFMLRPCGNNTTSMIECCCYF